MGKCMVCGLKTVTYSGICMKCDRGFREKAKQKRVNEPEVKPPAKSDVLEN